MDSNEFIELSKSIVFGYVNERLDVTNDVEFTEDDVFIVWISKTLQNNKALISTTLSDGMYYEVTRNGDKKETYLDAYKKVQNIVYKM